jgi:GNAT superfamily N-acetyltransferase
MSEAVSIRLAQDADVAALEVLIPLAVRGLSGPFYSSKQIESAVAHVFGVDRQLIADGTYFVAETSSGNVVACGGWSRRKTMFGGDQTGFKEPNDTQLNPARDAARLRAFFVHPEFSRRGIGRRIVERCEREARDAGFTSMELVATLPGEPLYAALGFRVVERSAVALPEGMELAIARMRRSLAADSGA